MVPVGESSEHGVPNEGGAVREGEEEEVGMREVTAAGEGAERDDSGGGEGVDECAGNSEMGLNLFDVSHGKALV